MAKRWAHQRHLLEYAGFRVVAALMSALPLEIASSFSGKLWKLVAPRLKRHKRALAHLAIAFPDMTEAERDRVAHEMWGHLGRTFAEFFHMEDIDREGRVDFERPDIVEQMASNGPYVVCAPHLGNWEIMARASARGARPIAGIYQPLTNPLVDQALYDLRAPMYPLGLLPRSTSTMRKLMKIARDGGSIGFLADLREGKGIPAQFFGRPAFSNSAPALIARTYGMPIYAARVIRKPGVRFGLRVELVEVPKTADRDADVRAITADIQARFEEFIREAPEQWMWAHRRWD